MKRIFSAVLALAFTLCAAGCGQSAASGSAAPESAPAAESAAAENPASSESAPASGDRTGVECFYGTEYRNALLGFAVSFPEEWTGNYTPAVYSGEDWYGTHWDWVEFCYKDDTAGPFAESAMLTVARVTRAGWEAYIAADEPKWQYAGENGDYIYCLMKPDSNPYTGADAELMQKITRSGFGTVTVLDIGEVRTDIPVMTAEMQEYYNKYLPYGGPYATSLCDFDENDYFPIRKVYFLFNYAYGLANGFGYIGSNEDKLQPDYPAELVESTIRKYFLFDTAELRADSDYRAGSASYHFEGGYGGGYYAPVVTAARQEGDLLELDIEQWGDSYTGGSGYILEYSYTLTLRLEPDGGWKYLRGRVNSRYEPAN